MIRRQLSDVQWRRIEAVLRVERGVGRRGNDGGLSTKVHLVVDALGLPLTFEVTEGQHHDSRPAKALIGRALSSCLLADKAYDSDEFRAVLAGCDCTAVIPSNASRAQKLLYDREPSSPS